MELPHILNGHRVIKIEAHNNCATVMCDAPGKYIVATWWPELKTSWMWGQYFHTGRDDIQEPTAWDEASLAFNATALRNERRNRT